MKKYIVLGLMSLLFACKKNNHQSLSGIYIETSPNMNATQLDFISDDQVKITSSEAGFYADSTGKVFTYQFTDDKLIFFPTDTSQFYADPFVYKQMGSSSFSLNTCVCTCPCAAQPLFIFTKKE